MNMCPHRVDSCALKLANPYSFEKAPWRTCVSALGQHVNYSVCFRNISLCFLVSLEHLIPSCLPLEKHYRALHRNTICVNSLQSLQHIRALYMTMPPFSFDFFFLIKCNLWFLGECMGVMMFCDMHNMTINFLYRFVKELLQYFLYV